MLRCLPSRKKSLRDYSGRHTMTLRRRGFLTYLSVRAPRRPNPLIGFKVGADYLLAEIRFQIYETLLIRKDARLLVEAARSGVSPATLSIKQVVRCHDSPLQTFGYQSPDEWSLDEIAESPQSWCEHRFCDQHLLDSDASPILCNRCRASVHVPWRSSAKTYVCEDEIPSAAILSTCRTIAAEATSMLYCDNTIQINLGSSNSAGRRCNPSGRDIQPLCSDIFRLDPDTWSTRVALSFRSSVFVAFLNAIGPKNARLIQSLALSSSDADQIANRLPTITSLAALHMPGLKQLKICVSGHDMDPNICCLSCDHPNPASPWYPFWRYGGFLPLRKALEFFVEQIPWIEDLEYEGQMVARRYDDRGGYRRLKALECVVRQRKEGAA